MPPAGARHGAAASSSYPRLPYAAYGRVRGFLVDVDGSGLEGSPPRLADGAFEGAAQGTRDQLIASLGALGLLEAGRLASTELIRIVRGEAETRRAVLLRRVEEVFAGAIELMEAVEPLHEIDRWIEQHGYSGGTVRRVRSFLLAAVEDLDIPVDLRPYRIRVRRKVQNVGAETREQYAVAGAPEDWREARTDEYVGVLIGHLNSILRDAQGPEVARDYAWLFDRIERCLHPPDRIQESHSHRRPTRS